MNDPWRLMRRAVAALALFSAAASAVAQPAGTAGREVPPDPFVAEFEAAVAGYRAALGFSSPVDPLRPLSPPAARPAPPYSLGDLLGLASVGNPGLAANASAEDAARAEFAAARARRLPTLKTETTGTYIGNPSEPIVLPGALIGSPVDITLYEGSGSALYDFKLVGDLPVFSWGKIALGIDLARTGLDAASLQRLKAGHELAVRMRASWDALACTGRAGRVIDLQARIGARLVEIAGQSAAAGFMTAAELANVRISLKEIEMARTRLDERRDRLLSDLASMAGLEELGFDELDLEVPAAGAPRWTEAGIWPVALEGSYDLALLSVLLESKRGLGRLAGKEALGLPDIGLHVELSYGGSSLPFVGQDWRDDDDYQLTVSLGASGSLLGNAVKRAEAARARAELAEAEARLADSERSIKAYIRETYLGIDLGRAQLEHAALRQDSWAAELEQRRATIMAGAGSETDYLSMMLDALGGLAEAYGTLAGYRSSLLSLEAAAGSLAGR